MEADAAVGAQAAPTNDIQQHTMIRCGILWGHGQVLQMNRGETQLMKTGETALWGRPDLPGVTLVDT
jgi:hypothetical protein